MSLSGAGVHLMTTDFSGDKTGRLTVRKGQELFVDNYRLLLPSALLAQQASEVILPIKVDCRAVDSVLKGVFHHR